MVEFCAISNESGNLSGPHVKSLETETKNYVPFKIMQLNIYKMWNERTCFFSSNVFDIKSHSIIRYSITTSSCRSKTKDSRFASRVSRFRRGTWDHLVPKLRNSLKILGPFRRGVSRFRSFAFRVSLSRFRPSRRLGLSTRLRLCLET